MLSMTGFGKGEAVSASGIHLNAELRSVNRKQFELRVNVPAECAALEIAARRFLAERVSRGSLQLRITVTGTAAQACPVDTVLLDRLIRAAQKARSAAGLPDTVDVEALMGLPGVVSAAELPDAESPGILSAFQEALQKAFDAFDRMRAAEGAALQKDLSARAGHLEQLLAELEKCTAGAPAAARKRLLDRLKKENIPVAPDDPAFLKEVLFYVDKSDVAEEQTRLHSHFQQFRKFLAQKEPCGSSMDFLVQEFFREINTLGNKALLPGVSPLVVAFKSELEKIREQIQNVE